jgi:hypothetical protein
MKRMSKRTEQLKMTLLKAMMKKRKKLRMDLMTSK